MKRNTLITVLLFACLSIAAWAHGGMDHVIGTVMAITHTSITVQTTAQKTVEVELTNSTVYEHEGKAAAQADIHVGDRVVIHAMKMNGKLEAHSVRFANVNAHSAGTAAK